MVGTRRKKKRPSEQLPLGQRAWASLDGTRAGAEGDGLLCGLRYLHRGPGCCVRGRKGWDTGGGPSLGPSIPRGRSVKAGSGQGRRGVCSMPWPRGQRPGQGGEQEQSSLPGTHLEALKMCLALVHMALMGLSWPLISPMGVKLSTFQTLMTPARQALSSMGRPGTKARAHTQSLCAVGICCGRSEP